MAVRKFSGEEKLKAVKAVLASPEAVNVTARRLGLHPQTVHRWIAEYRGGGAEAWRAPQAKRRGRFDERIKRLAVQRAGDGSATLTAVAAELGISVALLSKWVHEAERAGSDAFRRERRQRNRRFSEDVKSAAVKAARGGMPLADVAAEFGASESLLRSWMKRKESRARKIKRQWYSQDFKNAAVKAAMESEAVMADVARAVGVLPQVLYEWVDAYKKEGECFANKPRRIARVYDEAFKRKAVAMARDPRNVPARVARELGISKGLLSKWLSAR